LGDRKNIWPLKIFSNYLKQSLLEQVDGKIRGTDKFTWKKAVKME